MAFAKFKEQSLLKRFQKELRNAPETRTPNAKEIHSVAILTNEALYSSVDIVNQVKSNIESVRTVQIYSYKNFKKNKC